VDEARVGSIAHCKNFPIHDRYTGEAAANAIGLPQQWRAFVWPLREQSGVCGLAIPLGPTPLRPITGLCGEDATDQKSCE
jgi:hypothetical protein